MKVQVPWWCPCWHHIADIPIFPCPGLIIYSAPITWCPAPLTWLVATIAVSNLCCPILPWPHSLPAMSFLMSSRLFFFYDFHFISLIWCHIISVLFLLPHLSSPAQIWLWILSAFCSPFLSLKVWIWVITHIPQSAFCFVFLANLWSGLLPPRTFNCLPFQLCHPPHFFFYFFSVTGNLAAFHHF